MDESAFPYDKEKDVPQSIVDDVGYDSSSTINALVNEGMVFIPAATILSN